MKQFKRYLDRMNLRKLLSAFLIVLFTVSALPAFAGTTHTEGGPVANAADGTLANGTPWRLIMTSRPAELITGTVGTPTPGFWRADVGAALPTQWQVGDDHLVVVDQEINPGAANHAGYYGVINKDVTSSDPDQYSGMTLRAIPVPQVTAGNNQVSMTWTAAVADVGTPDRSATNIASYEIFRSTAATGPFTAVGTVAATSTSFTDTTAVNGTTYFYQLRLVYRVVSGTPLRSLFGSSNSAAATPPGGSGTTPTVTGIAPSTGANNSTTPITITGTNFTGATGGTVGTTPLTNFTVVSPTQITANVPAGITPAAHNVAVTTPSGTSAANPPASTFTVTDGGAPAVTGVSPNTGPNSTPTPVTITGTNLTGATGGTVGTTPLTNFTVVSPTQVTGTVPAGITPGDHNVAVTSPNGTSAANPPASTFTVTSGAPTVTGINPSTGQNGTTTPITVTGTNFTGTTAVNLGNVPLTFTVNSPTQISSSVPTGLIPGVYDLTVTTPQGTSASNPPASQFTVTAGGGGGTGGDASSPLSFAGTGESTSSVRWSWIDTSINETGFRIQDTNNNNIITTPANTTATSESGLAPNTTVTRQARAFNTNGQSNPSNTASATTLASPPASVTPTNTTASSTTLNIVPGPGGASGFNVYRSEVIAGTPGPFTFVGSTPTNNPNQFTDTGLTPTTTYIFQARSLNTPGQENPNGTNSSQITTQADSNPPTISNVRLDGLSPQSGDVIGSKPLITATITDDVAVDPATISISIGGQTFTTATTPAVTFTATNGATSVQVATAIPDGTYTLTVTARDTAGNPATFTTTLLRVQATGGPLANPPYNYKNPFNPNGGETTNIVIDLTRAGNVTILLFDTTARLVYRQDVFLQAGHNEVTWNGRTSYGELAANGVYLMRILVDGTFAGRGKIWVVNK